MSFLLQLPSHLWLRLALYLSWQERLVQATRLCAALVSPASCWGERDHLHLTVPVFDALCSFNRSSTRALSSAASVSVNDEVAAEILRDGDAPLRTLLTSLSQLPDADAPMSSARSLCAAGEFVQCALDCHLPLSRLSSLCLHPVTPCSERTLARNRLWCALFSLPELRRLKLERYVLNEVDHSVLFSLRLERLDLSGCSRAQRAGGGMSAVGVARSLRALLLEADSAWTDREEVDALILNLSHTPCLRYVALSAVFIPYQLRLLSSIQQLTAVDLSASKLEPAYLSYFVTPRGDAALPRLLRFSTARVGFVQCERCSRGANQRLSGLLRFARAYSQLRTCKVALGTEALHSIAVVVAALSELAQVRTLGLRVLHRAQTIRHDEQHDSEQDEESEREEQKGSADPAKPSASPAVAPQSVTLRWLSIVELEGVTLQDASLLTVLTGCERLRRVTCRNCDQQTTAAWLLAAVNASHLISLILYAEEVKATAAAWKQAAATFPHLAHLIDPPAAVQLPSSTQCNGYPGLAHVEIRLLSAEHSDESGFASLMNLLTAAPLTALNMHLPLDAVLCSRVRQLRHMAHIQSLSLTTLPVRASQQHDSQQLRQDQQVAERMQHLLSRCVRRREPSQQQHAEWVAERWDGELMGDGREGGEGSLLSQQAAVAVLMQDDDYTQEGGLFSQSFTKSAGDGQMAGREQFFHELAGLCQAEDD